MGAGSPTGAAWPAPTAARPVDATVSVPGSKSLTNRYLVLAALAEEPSRLRSPLHSRDTALMAAALGALGVRFEQVPGTSAFGPDWVVTPGPLRGPADVDCGLAGTVMRFVPPVAALATGAVRFDGDPAARRRPMATVVRALRDLGVQVDDGPSPEQAGRLPFTVHGTGAVRGGTLRVDASASSQFVSGLLLAGARFTEGLTLEHVGSPIPSTPHVVMTVEALRDVGVVVDDADPATWRVEPGPVGALDVQVEPDLSNAAPFVAAAAVTGGRVRVPDWPQYTTQAGDLLRDLLDQMGAEVNLDRDGLTVEGTGELYGIDADLADAGELATTVAALCGARRRALPAARHRARPRVTRPTGSRPSPPRSTGWAATSARPPTASSSGPGPCTAGCSEPTATTGWPPPAHCSGCGSRACSSRTSRRRRRPSPGSPVCGRRCWRRAVSRG